MTDTQETSNPEHDHHGENGPVADTPVTPIEPVKDVAADVEERPNGQYLPTDYLTALIADALRGRLLDVTHPACPCVVKATVVGPDTVRLDVTYYTSLEQGAALQVELHVVPLSVALMDRGEPAGDHAQPEPDLPAEQAVADDTRAEQPAAAMDGAS